MHLDPTTLALQTLNFLVLVWLLRRFLYKPVAAAISKRQAEVDAALADAQAKKDAADKLQADAQTKVRAIENERAALLEKSNVEAQAEREHVLAAARSQADADLQAAREKLAEERAAVLAELSSRAAAVAVDLAGKMLQKAGIDQVDTVFLDRILARLDQLPSAQSRSLSADVASGKRPRITTSSALDEATKLRVRKTMAARLGATDVDFAVDATLIGGAELRLATLVISQNLRDMLAEAQKTLETPLADAR